MAYFVTGDVRRDFRGQYLESSFAFGSHGLDEAREAQELKPDRMVRLAGL
jgi:hypothetical protein